MSSELIAAIIGFVFTLTGLVKVYTDLVKVKKDREEVKLQRDMDSRDLHDATQKNIWEVGILREEINLLKTHQQDTEHEISLVVKELAIVSTKLDNLIELVKQEHTC